MVKRYTNIGLVLVLCILLSACAAKVHHLSEAEKMEYSAGRISLERVKFLDFSKPYQPVFVSIKTAQGEEIFYRSFLKSLQGKHKEVDLKPGLYTIKVGCEWGNATSTGAIIVQAHVIVKPNTEQVLGCRMFDTGRKEKAKGLGKLFNKKKEHPITVLRLKVLAKNRFERT